MHAPSNDIHGPDLPTWLVTWKDYEVATRYVPPPLPATSISSISMGSFSSGSVFFSILKLLLCCNSLGSGLPHTTVLSYTRVSLLGVKITKITCMDPDNFRVWCYSVAQGFMKDACTHSGSLKTFQSRRYGCWLLVQGSIAMLARLVGSYALNRCGYYLPGDALAPLAALPGATRPLHGLRCFV